MQKQKNYACSICKTTPDQLSHHKGHLDTDKHQTKAELFKLQLEKLSEDKLLEKYNTIDYEVILEGLINITSDYILQIENKDTIEKDDIDNIDIKADKTKITIEDILEKTENKNLIDDMYKIQKLMIHQSDELNI